MSHTRTYRRIPKPEFCRLCRGDLTDRTKEFIAGLLTAFQCQHCYSYSITTAMAFTREEICLTQVRYASRIDTEQEYLDVTADIKRAVNEGRELIAFPEHRAFAKLAFEDNPDVIFYYRQYFDWLQDHSPQFDKTMAIVQKEIEDYDKERIAEGERQAAAYAEAAKERKRQEAMFPNAAARGDFDAENENEENLDYLDPPEVEDEYEETADGDAPPQPGPDPPVAE